MTLAPTTPVRGVEGKPAEINVVCSAPGCISRAQHGHHIWPRSYLRGQPYDWVRMPTGRVVFNKTGLCERHHLWVTGDLGGHKARIEYVGGQFWWHDLREPQNDGPLYPQPGGQEQGENIPISGDAGAGETQKALEMHPHRQLAEGESCPECGYTKPRRAPGPKRKTKTWGVTVPDDAEDGAELLDALVDDFAAVLGMQPESKRLLRYHVLMPVLLWAAQRLPEFVQDVREAAGGNGHP